MDRNRLAVIGAGPAGITAAIYGARSGLDVSVFDGGFVGGQTAWTSEIENYPGVDFIEGYEFANRLKVQAEKLGVKFINENVESINCGGSVSLKTQNGGDFDTDVLIAAFGAKHRKIGCPGEEELAGRGVSYCATCDGAFFKGKTAIVYGGGNTAAENALYLSNVCDKVIIVYRKDKLRSEKVLADAVLSRDNIEIKFNSTIVEIVGEDNGAGGVTGAVIEKQDGSRETISAGAVFVAIGMQPENQALAESGVVDIDEQGYVIADESCRTDDPRVFVSGDCRTKEHRQIVTAVADGAVAAMNAVSYLNALN